MGAVGIAIGVGMLIALAVAAFLLYTLVKETNAVLTSISHPFGL